MITLPKMYAEYAPYWHLISGPEDYEEEAYYYAQAFRDFCSGRPQTVLELGSGGGNNAYHLKKYFNLTLVDLSADMLAVSRQINPELAHLQGDMRNVRLGRVFDVVFIHDAVMYMHTEEDLLRAFETAAVHCRGGGMALFAPDEVKETFEPFTDCGGKDDGQGWGIRYLEWGYDPNPEDTTYVMDFAYLLRKPDGEVVSTYDRHFIGLFPRQTWLDLLVKAGFEPEVLVDGFGRDVFACRRK